MHVSLRYRWLRWIGVAVALLGRVERRSEACTCTAATIVSPAPGSIGVPTNAELFSRSNGPGNATLVGGGESVEIDLQQLTCGGYRYRASLVLQPDTSYEVLQYDPPQVLTSFTTGAGPDLTPPMDVRIDALWFGLDGAEAPSDCGGRAQVELSVDAPGATTLLVHRETSLGGCDMIIFPEETGNFGSPFGDDCRVFTALEAGEDYCWEVRARDLAGNEGAATRRCAEVLECASADATGNLSDCESPSWFGCAATPPDGAPATALLVGAAIGAILLRRRRRRS